MVLAVCLPNRGESCSQGRASRKLCERLLSEYGLLLHTLCGHREGPLCTRSIWSVKCARRGPRHRAFPVLCFLLFRCGYSCSAFFIFLFKFWMDFSFRAAPPEAPVHLRRKLHPRRARPRIYCTSAESAVLMAQN